MQQFFAESSGAIYYDTTLNFSSSPPSVVASAVSYKSSTDKKDYIRIKVGWFIRNYH